MATVASSTRMPTASARPPSVMTFSVSPIAASTASETRIDSGIETSTISVERHEPRKVRIISPVSPAAIAPSRATSPMAFETNTDWSNSGVIWVPLGAAAWTPPSSDLTWLTTLSVDALPFLRMVSSTARRPFARTMFCCTWAPSRTQATSRISTVRPPTTLTGTSFSAATASGEPFSRTTYCSWPSFIRPDGTVTFSAVIAFVTSCGVRP